MKAPMLLPRIQILYANKQQEVAEVLARLLQDGAGVAEKQIEMMGWDYGPPDEWDPYRRAPQCVIALLSDSFLASSYCLALLGLAVVQCSQVIPCVLPLVEEHEEVSEEAGLQTPATIWLGVSDEVDRLGERLMSIKLVKKINKREWGRLADQLTNVSYANASRLVGKELSHSETLGILQKKIDSHK